MEKSIKRLYGIIALLSLALLAALFGGLFNRSALGGPAGPATLSGSEVGRYQITAAGTGTSVNVFIMDTKTGRCWEATSGDVWSEVTPDYAKPKRLLR
jgi:hypothetical protein